MTATCHFCSAEVEISPEAVELLEAAENAAVVMCDECLKKLVTVAPLE